MPAKLYLATSILTLAVSQDLAMRLIHKKNRDMALIVTKIRDHSKSLEEQMEYMIHLLNEHEITLDEFDLIALPSITQKS